MVKERKMAQNDKNLFVMSYISGTIRHMIFIYGIHLFQIFIVRVGSGVKAKYGPK